MFIEPSLKKFSLYCAEHRLSEVVKLLSGVEGVRLLQVFDKHYRFVTDRKQRLRRVARHEVVGVCPLQLTDEIVQLLSSRKVYGFHRVTNVSFSDISYRSSVSA